MKTRALELKNRDRRRFAFVPLEWVGVGDLRRYEALAKEEGWGVSVRIPWLCSLRFKRTDKCLC